MGSPTLNWRFFHRPATECSTISLMIGTKLGAQIAHVPHRSSALVAASITRPVPVDDSTSAGAPSLCAAPAPSAPPIGVTTTEAVGVVKTAAEVPAYTVD